MYTELKIREVTKRKKATGCSWCGERINIGDKAVYRAYIFDGFQTDYNHPECFDAMGNLKNEVDKDYYWDLCQDGWSPGEWFRGTCKNRND